MFWILLRCEKKYLWKLERRTISLTSSLVGRRSTRLERVRSQKRERLFADQQDRMTWRDMLRMILRIDDWKTRWELLLARLRLKSIDEAVDSITRYFLKKRLLNEGAMKASSPEDILREAEEKAQNLPKVKPMMRIDDPDIWSFYPSERPSYPYCYTSHLFLVTFERTEMETCENNLH